MEMTTQQIDVGSKVTLRKDALQRHSHSIPAYMGYSTEQFQWRKTLARLLGMNEDFKQVNKPMIGIVSRVFEKSLHVNVKFVDGTTIGIDKTELTFISNP